MNRAAAILTLGFFIWIHSASARADGGGWITEALRAFPVLNLQSQPDGSAPVDPGITEGEYATPHPAVARIVVPEPDGTTYGSGTLVDARGEYGLVVTNWHVVEHTGNELWIEFADGFRSAGKLLKVDRDWDLAAIAIWRPNGKPVALAKVAPRPGDKLVIAGYGSGPFRAARGECLQYVTPSLNLPLEMVQVTAAARNGDSGGPIFNEQGELAGVLFGTGEGVTSGSYCGRVNEFLASVLPKETEPTAVSESKQGGNIFSRPKQETDVTRPTTVTPEAATQAPPATVQDFGLLDAVDPPPAPPSAIEEQPPTETTTPSALLREASLDLEETAVRDFGPAPRSVEDEPAPTAAAAVPAHSEVDWMALAGTSTGERLKTALALVGFCTLLWHTVRVLSGSRPASAA